jgi:hypothetical protein
VAPSQKHPSHFWRLHWGVEINTSKKESQSSRIMPPKLRQKRSQRKVSVHTKHSHAESAANVQGQDPPQPPPSDPNREVTPTNLMLELIQSLQQNHSELAEAIKQLKEKDAGTKTLPQNEGGN